MADNICYTFEHLKLILEQFKQQRDTQDRWFKFYLLLIGTPITLITPLYSTSSGTDSDLINLSILIASLFLFVLGVFFSLMYTRQRINNLTLYAKFQILEYQYVESKLYKKFFDKNIPPKEGFNKNGADFYVGLSQIFINSFWLAIFTLFLIKTTTINNNISIIVVAGVFLLIFLLQYFVRSRLLMKFEDIKTK